MGGREVGGLANSLAAHMELENAEHRRHRAASSGQRRGSRSGRASKPSICSRPCIGGRIKALWIMATNPVVSLPERGPRARSTAALRTRGGVRLCGANRHHRPRARTAAGGRVGREGWHSHQLRPAYFPPARFLPAAGRGTTRLVDHLPKSAERMGFHARFQLLERPAEIFDEHARLSAVGNDGCARLRSRRAGGARRAGLRGPRARPMAGPGRGMRRGTPRLFADGRFYHADGRARLIATRPSCPAKFALDDEYPLVLNTGRIRDQWHTMTRTGRSPRLARAPSRALRRHASRGCAALSEFAAERSCASSPDGAAWSRACAPAVKLRAGRSSCRSIGATRRVRCSRGRIGLAERRPLQRRAGVQGHAGPH